MVYDICCDTGWNVCFKSDDENALDDYGGADSLSAYHFEAAQKALRKNDTFLVLSISQEITASLL